MAETNPKPPSVVFEDAEVLALNKPAGQAVIPGRGEIGQPLSEQARRQYGGKIYVVHRIDREASGLVIFAKTASAHRRLSMAFERGRVKKTYWAAVAGVLEKNGRVQSRIFQFGSGRMGVDSARGKKSSTFYSIKENFKDATWLEVRPQTGRRHQIRVHLYSLGHPILGDPFYGRPLPVGGFPRLMLHAYSLRLEDAPQTSWRAEPDALFLELLQKLRARPKQSLDKAAESSYKQL